MTFKAFGLSGRRPVTHGVPAVLAAILLCLPTAQAAAGSQAYPNSRLLAEPEDLSRPAPRVVLDVRPRAAYAAGHIPGAVWIDTELWATKSREAGALEDAALWARLVGDLGIDGRTPVVVYDEVVTPTAARIWWLLRYVGLPDVRIVNGGLAAWEKAHGAVTGEVPQVTRANFQPRFQPHMLANRHFIAKSLGQPGVCLVDARTEAEYNGQPARGATGGRIPGARHLEWTNFVDENGRMKPAGEIRKLVEEHQITADQTIVAYCRSGGKASLNAFALELMGLKSVRNYYGSWLGWSADPSLPTEPRP
ncbi:MAG TPA: sulfurtransferase [Planctomycetaceae bacterium]|nr:sulfurtransferase [Planctomycetaceae bacterium]HIQ21611.1 sulfurtransferase [Planctomycetota bacterium]